MKTFSTSGTGNEQTLSEIESEKIPVYDSETDLDADLANLADGQIVATKDTGTELSQPVDVVEEGNLHAVTSNAVAESLSYSTTEHKTGKKWIDGKDIYRKVVQKNIAITNGVDIDLSDIAIDTPISLDYVLQDGAGGSIIAYNTTNITFNFYKSGSTNKAHILINTIGGWNLRQATQNFIIVYTKTTD